MDRSNTQVFKIKDKKIEKVVDKRNDFIEKEVQKFYEDNLERLLGCTFIHSELQIENGRIDTFAIDEDNRPTIIEYKRESKDTVLLQALFYKNFLQRFPEVAEKFIIKKKGLDFLDEVNWNNLRVIIVAQDFDKWTIASTTFLEGVDLYSFNFYGDSFIQEYRNETKQIRQRNKSFTYKRIESEAEVIQNGDLSIPTTKDADYSVAEWVRNEKSGKAYRTNLYQLNQFEKTQELFELLSDKIEESFPSAELVKNAYYWSYKIEKKFLEVIFQKNKLMIQINLDEKDITNEPGIEFLGNKGSWGTLKYVFYINNSQDIEKFWQYILLSYAKSNEK